MIARIWRGAVRKEDGDAYARYMQDTGIAGYARTPGNRAVHMLRRDVGDLTEFVMYTLWELTSPFLASPPLVETKKIVLSSSQQPSRRLNFAPPSAQPWLNVLRGSPTRASSGSGSSIRTHW